MKHRGGGSYVNRSKKIIVIDPVIAQNPTNLIQTLAHETGHAMYKPDPYIPYSKNNLTRQEYIDQNTMRDLKDEGEATIVNIEVQREILNNGGPDIGISGTQKTEYLKIYKEEVVTNQSREKARERIGSIFADKESPSTTSSGETYRDYYSKAYKDHYDNDGENP